MSPVKGETLNVWGVELAASELSEDEIAYLSSLPISLPTVEWVQGELDSQWKALGLDNRRNLAGQPVDAYYSHPVWVMNGVFTAADPVSQAHRRALADYVASLDVALVAEYGGGFGELARRIAEAAPNAQVSVIEPFAHRSAVHRLSDLSNVTFRSDLEGPYDVLIAQDVLEHVERPIGLALQLASAVRVGGTVVFANNFCPVEACHLPRTFYLRHTFVFVMRGLGLSFSGTVAGCTYALIFTVVREPRLIHVRIADGAARFIGRLLNLADRLPVPFRGALGRLLRRRRSGRNT